MGVPILGICYGMQEIAYQYNNDIIVARTAREYGHADLKATRVNGHVDRPFEGLEDDIAIS